MPPALVQRVVAYIRKHDMVRAGDRLGVALSGGADSVALLRLMLELRNELGIVLSVVHFNHRIRGEAADGDDQFVRDLAATHGLELHVSSADTPAYANEKKLSLEAAARELRYAYFESVMRSAVVNKVATAHTLDDQAETVLLRIIRGTGTTGLAGIHPRLRIAGLENSAVLRPLLQVRRPELEAYLNGLGQNWREDATNQDTNYTRNRVRHSLLPLIEREFNPAVRDRLAELAEIARCEEDFWIAEVERALVAIGSAQSDRVSSELSLPADELLNFPIGVQRRVLRLVAGRLSLNLDFRHVDDVLSLLKGGTNAIIDLPGGGTAEHRMLWGPGPAPSRLGSELLLRRPNDEPLAPAKLATHHSPLATDYAYSLPVPGDVRIPELDSVISARLLDLGADRLKVENNSGEAAATGYNPNQLLDPQTLAPELTVRNWHPGDRFWPAHTATPKKIKELLQQRHVTGTERQLWPVILSGDDIVWMKGFPAAQRHRPTSESGKALLIEIKPLGSTER